MREILLAVRSLKTYFYTDEGVVRAVDGVSFQIKRGEIFGLVGETGCGKSVTALSIMGLLPSTGKIVDGEIIYKGRDLLSLSKNGLYAVRGREIAMVFQNPMSSLDPVYTVGFQIAEPLIAHRRLSRGEAWKNVVTMIERVRISDPETTARVYPHQLSGGMRQRSMIAMMLSCNPSLLITDEPTTALDVTIQAQILELLRKLREELGTSILMITHDLGVIAELCERVGVMYCGMMVELADVETLFEKPMHPYTQGLLGSIPTGRKERLATIPGSIPKPINPPSGCRFHPRCQKKMEICKNKPTTIEAEKDHFVACHLYE
jgi:oligopeptide/dipeptide ABC transporter ATP-binding protein